MMIAQADGVIMAHAGIQTVLMALKMEWKPVLTVGGSVCHAPVLIQFLTGMNVGLTVEDPVLHADVLMESLMAMKLT